MLAAAVALVTFVVYKKPTRSERAELVERSLMSAGLIILITAAGGAFGAMLKVAEIGPAIEAAFASADAMENPIQQADTADTSSSKPPMGGVTLLCLAFGVASLLKFSQGSSTVAMITASAMLAAMIDGQALPYNPVYVAQAIGCGALFGVWMNDSGFWLFCRMGGLTEVEGLKTWTTILAVIATTAMLVNVGLAISFPMLD